MKRNYIFIGLLLASSLLVSFSHDGSSSKLTKYVHLNGSGSPGGKTGAPGDAACTQCHTGTVQSGSGFNLVTLSTGGNPVTDYLPNTVYQVTVSMSTANAKNGFEIVPLNPSNAMAGTIAITDATNTKTISALGKTRVTQKAAGNSLATWTFNWTSPASNVGDITFYLATNQTNSDTGSDGDIIRTSQHVFGSTAGIQENSSKLETKIAYSSNTNALNIQLDSKVSGLLYINVVDLNGKSVFVENLGKVNEGESAFAVRLNQELNNGIYMVNVSVDNNITMKKIFISK